MTLWRVLSGATCSRSTVVSQMRPRTSASASRGAMKATISPPRMTAIRPQRFDTSETMCVESSTTVSSPAISESRLWKRLRSSGSRPAVGSSTMTRRGLPISACAMPSRRRMPPEKPPTG